MYGTLTAIDAPVAGDLPTVALPDVSTTTEFVVLFRFDDLTGGDLPVDSFERPYGVPLDMTTSRVIGDASTQRWYFFSYVTVAP